MPDPAASSSPGTRDAAPDVTVLITTKNRKDDLRKAVASAVAQAGCTVEVFVIDDGSTDGTSEMVAHDFPAVRLERVTESQGYIVQRNRGTRTARAPIVVVIDDDAVLATPHVCAGVLKDFDTPRVGAVAIPYIDKTYSETVLQRAPSNEGVWVTAYFRGTAQAVRKDVFVKLGEYPPEFLHQVEEIDYCIRLLGAGYVVRAGRGDVIHHFESPRRDLTRQIRCNARNNLLFLWRNVPMPRMLLFWVGSTLNLLRFGVKKGYTRATIVGLWQATLGVLTGATRRNPVPGSIHTLYRRLLREMVSLDEIEHLLRATEQFTPR